MYLPYIVAGMGKPCSVIRAAGISQSEIGISIEVIISIMQAESAEYQKFIVALMDTCHI